MKQELPSSKILSKTQRWDNSKRNKGWGRSLWTDRCSLLALIAPHCPSPLSPHNSSSAMSVSPCRYALQTEHLGWAAQRAWLSFARSVAVPVCLCPPTPRDIAAAPFPLLSSWWAWGPQSCVLPCPPLKSPGAALSSCSLPPSLINGFLIEPLFSYPSFCKFKSCSLVLLTSCWPTS